MKQHFDKFGNKIEQNDIILFTRHDDGNFRLGRIKGQTPLFFKLERVESSEAGLQGYYWGGGKVSKTGNIIICKKGNKKLQLK